MEKYIKPKSKSIELFSQEMLAASENGVQSFHNSVGSKEQFSNGNVWDCSEWSENPEEADS